MLEPKYYDLKALSKRVKVRPEPREGWKHAAFGGVSAMHFDSPSHVAKAIRIHKTAQPVIGESKFEIMMLFSILEEIRSEKMIFMELGAGWGAQTLIVATAVRNRVVQTRVESVKAYAVEAQPGHHEFVCETFVENHIDGVPIYGAVSDSVGFVPFYSMRAPQDEYGQSMRPDGNLTVPCYTIDYLMGHFGIEHVDLVHMDIQHQEPQALQGALPVIGAIDYLIVCPHQDVDIPKIEALLEPTHYLVVSFGPFSGQHELPGFPLPICHPEDGIMVWGRKGL